MIILRKTTLLPFILPILIFMVQFANGATTTQRISREEYISRYKHIAIEHQQYYGIPASITMAQGILESDSGNSRLARGSNNHFGIKCKSNWRGRTFAHTDDAPNECFRAYDSVEESYEDHAIFLDSSPRYDSLFRFAPTDYRSWARGLKGAGYATAPDYAVRLVKLIEDNKLYNLDIIAAGGVVETADSPTKDVARSEEGAAATASPQVDPNNYHVSVDSHGGYNIYRTNRTCYIVAKRDDTLKSISMYSGISEKRLRKYNDLEKSGEISGPGVLYIERKQVEWMGNIHTHRVLEGETLHSISQKYAIRESSLRKMNRLKKGKEPVVGANLNLQ